MAYLNTKNITLAEHSVMSLSVSPYTKLVNVKVKNGELLAIFLSEQIDNWSNSKIFNFKVIRGQYQTNIYIDSFYNYFDTVKIIDDERVEWYHIFYQEIKTIEESRNERIDTFLNQEF